MKHRNTQVINGLTVVLTILIVFMALDIFFYFYPRQIVEPTTTTTTSNAYRVGDEVRVSGESQVFINGRETNVVALQCGVASYLIRTISLPTRKTDGKQAYEFAIGDIPDGVKSSPPKCKVMSRTTYYVKYFLMFERSYTVQLTSNEFDIIK